MIWRVLEQLESLPAYQRNDTLALGFDMASTIKMTHESMDNTRNTLTNVTTNEVEQGLVGKPTSSVHSDVTQNLAVDVLVSFIRLCKWVSVIFHIFNSSDYCILFLCEITVKPPTPQVCIKGSFTGDGGRLLRAGQYRHTNFLVAPKALFSSTAPDMLNGKETVCTMSSSNPSIIGRYLKSSDGGAIDMSQPIGFLLSVTKLRPRLLLSMLCTIKRRHWCCSRKHYPTGITPE
jgi:hypothetical protein